MAYVAGKRLVILGAGGHARSLAHLIKAIPLGYRAATLVGEDDTVFPTDDVLIGVGDLPTRRRLYEQFKTQISPLQIGYCYLDRLPLGIQLMPNAIVMPNCTIGENVLINTGAQVDHDCVVGPHCHIAPGAILCGGVKLGEGCFVGAGAILTEGHEWLAGERIRAGSVNNG